MKDSEKTVSQEYIRIKTSDKADSILTKEIIRPNVGNFQREIYQLHNFIKQRLEDHTTPLDVKDYFTPHQDSVFTAYIKQHNLTDTDYLVLLCTLIFTWNPKSYSDLFFDEDEDQYDQIGTLKKFGFYFDSDSQIIRPTVQGLIALIAGDSKNDQITLLHYLEHHSKLFDLGVLITGDSTVKDLSHFLHKSLKMDNAYVSHFLTTEKLLLERTENFFADRLKTSKSLKDVVFDEGTWDKLQPLLDYIEIRREMFERLPDFAKVAKQGYISLFHGYPGTGKTFTASIIGNHFDIPVYRVNLARVISKYIGETEKNLENIFNRLQDEHCILFFDEADALFGKRSDVKEAKDRYANQEVAYLLQRIEQCNCFVILATNFKHNLDYAFKRRIDAFIEIKFPEKEERLKLWQTYMPSENFLMNPSNLLEHVAEKYAITGSQISNVCRHAAIEAYIDHKNVVTLPILERYLKEEYSKEGRLFSQPDVLPSAAISKN